MTDYGVQPTGFIRKPLSVILAEVEANIITEFGPGVIQTAQSPLGQINGVMADIVSDLWEVALDVHQSYDPDQAEGARIDTLARIRLLTRGDDTDEQFRIAVTNEGQARIDLQDLSRAIGGITGVTFHNVVVNDTGEVDQPLGASTIAVAVIGGDDIEIADTMRLFIVPGINTFGNTQLNTEVEGYCRAVYIIRPIDVPVTLDLGLRLGNDRLGCPPPASNAIIATLVAEWLAVRVNGLNVSHFTIRNIIESAYPMVEVLSINGSRDGIIQPLNTAVAIGFIEIASLATDNVTVTL